MTTNPDLYPTQFHHYLTRNLRYVLGLVQQAGPVLGDELRVQALHTLSYALQAPAVWPLTRELFLTLAPKMEQAGQRDHWIPYLQTALRQSEAQGDGAAAGECHFQLALLYRLLSHFAAAHEHLQAALAHFTALVARRDQARVLNELAWLEHLQHRYEDASHHVERAFALLDSDDIERAMSYRVQGMIAVGNRQWNEAETYHRLALNLFEKYRDQRKVAWSLQNLGYTLQQQTKYDEALIFYAQAVQMLQQQQDEYHLAIVLYNVGYTYSACGKTDNALDHYKLAEYYFNKLNDKLRLAKIYTDTGLAYLTIQDYSNACVMFSKSITHFTELGDESWRLNAMDGLAMVYLAQQNYAQSKAILEEALQALSMSPDIMNFDYLHKSLHKHWLELIEAQAR